MEQAQNFNSVLPRRGTLSQGELLTIRVKQLFAFTQYFCCCQQEQMQIGEGAVRYHWAEEHRTKQHEEPAPGCLSEHYFIFRVPETWIPVAKSLQLADIWISAYRGMSVSNLITSSFHPGTQKKAQQGPVSMTFKKRKSTRRKLIPFRKCGTNQEVITS